MTLEQEPFAEHARKLGYPSATCPPEHRKQWLEGEQASFDEEPDSCRYRVGSEEAFWWQQGYDAATAVTEALNEEASNRQ